MNNTARKGFFIFVLALLAAEGVFAQNWYDSYAASVEDNTLFINAGAGLGPGGWGTGIPPLSLSVDYRLPIDLPITAGGIVTYSTWERSETFSYFGDTYNLYDITFTNIGFGVRVLYHFNFLENLDTYAGAVLGYVYQSAKVKVFDDSFDVEIAKAESFPLLGISIGARYFFTDDIGAYIELGYSGLQYLSAGLSLKF